MKKGIFDFLIRLAYEDYDIGIKNHSTIEVDDTPCTKLDYIQIHYMLFTSFNTSFGNVKKELTDTITTPIEDFYGVAAKNLLDFVSKKD